MNGMPVSPSWFTRTSGVSSLALPPNATCTSFHCTTASPHAARTASAHISRAGLSPKRPNGSRPTPTMATSSISPTSDRLERERDDGGVVVLPERHDDQLHLHAEVELAGIGLGEAGLHPAPVRGPDQPAPPRRQ